MKKTKWFKMKKGIEWLATLPKDIQYKWLRNAISLTGKNQTRFVLYKNAESNFFDFVAGSFPWCDSNEGDNFWNKIAGPIKKKK
jgi:hypothetical protein